MATDVFLFPVAAVRLHANDSGLSFARSGKRRVTVLVGQVSRLNACGSLVQKVRFAPGSASLSCGCTTKASDESLTVKFP